MNRLLIRFPFRSVTFQTQRFGGSYTYKTEHQKSFLKSVESTLMANKKALQDLGKLFNPVEDVISTVWGFHYDNHITKKGTISSGCPDLENGKKMIQDSIFKVIGIDDKNICHTQDYKWSGKDEIILVVKILKREEFVKLIWN